jgi:hypothetical protein
MSLYDEIKEAVELDLLVKKQQENMRAAAKAAAKEQVFKIVGITIICLFCVGLIIWGVQRIEASQPDGADHEPDIPTISIGNNLLQAGVAYKFYPYDAFGREEDYQFTSQNFQGQPIYSIKKIDYGWIQITITKSDTYNLTITQRIKKNFWTGQPEP